MKTQLLQNNQIHEIRTHVMILFKIYYAVQIHANV